MRGARRDHEHEIVGAFGGLNIRHQAHHLREDVDSQACGIVDVDERTRARVHDNERFHPVWVRRRE
jgi:hypothetical protein